MKADIDLFMHEQGVDALLITGPAQHNPVMTWFTGLLHITDADLLKIRGRQPLLFVPPMEREEAQKSGLQTVSYSKYPLIHFMAPEGGDLVEAYAARYEKILSGHGFSSGRLALYGLKDVGFAHAVFSRLEKRLPTIEFAAFAQDEIILRAMMTKEDEEIARIRRMGAVTTAVAANVADFLCAQKAKGDLLVDAEGSPITIGQVKSRINLLLAENGAENPEGTIFSMGRDAAFPHSSGNDADPLRLGKTIVFDLFPCEAGGGYFYDFTRTWCLGFAPEDVLALYEDVRSVYHCVVSSLKLNQPFWQLQKMACEEFESKGHKSVLNNPLTETGYVHSLGHGLGLHIHEKPLASLTTHSDSDILAPGAVFTLEPGLYDPQREMGVRLEDTWLAKADGSFEMLADFPDDLILPIK